MTRPSHRVAYARRAVVVAAAACAACAPRERAANAPPAHWTLTAEQRFGPEGDVSYIGSVRIAPNGDLLASTGRPNRILDYASDGTLRRSLGRQGSGPGEFQVLAEVGAVGDSIYGVDGFRSQVSLFGPDGHLLRAWRVQPPGAGAAYNVPEALFADGTALIPVYVRTTPTQSDYTVQRARWDGSSPDTIIHVVTHTTEWRVGRFIASQPFQDDPVFSWSPDGRLVAVVDVAALDVGSDSVRITLRRLDKSVVYRRMVPLAHERLTAPEVDSAVAARSRALHLPEAEIRQSLYVPEFIAPVKSVLVGTDGTVWLRASRRNMGFTWLVIDKAGRAAATLSLPDAIDVLTIDRGVWGVERDSDGVPTVVRWRIDTGS